MTDKEDRVIRLEDYRPPLYRIPRVELDVDLDPTATLVTARLTVERAEGTAPGTPLVLDGDELALEAIAIDGAPLGAGSYAAAPDGLTIKAPPAEAFVLTLATRLDPSANTKLEGLYRSSGTYCTQCEAEGFRRITYFIDRPDVLSVYTTRITARRDEAPLLLSNGNPVEAGDLGDGRHFAVWHDPFPKPSYLFALVGGNLDAVSGEFTTMSGRKVALNIYVEHGKAARAGYALEALERSMRWDEEAFGREYDLDVFNIVAVADFNMGAMENKGLNIFNDKYILADPDTATDADYANIEAIIAHEYFHNWTGNRITCRDWFQLCLKEGLTVYRDQEFSSDMRSRPVKRIADVRMLMAYQFPEDAGPLAHPVRPQSYKEINNFYTATVYEKGAEVIRMLRLAIGAEAFAAGMQRYFEVNDGRAATIEDFLDAFAKVSGEDLSQFRLWYEQAGTPELVLKGSYDAAAASYTLAIEQIVPPTPGQASKQPMHIPLRIGLVGSDGRDLPLHAKGGARVDGDVVHVCGARHLVQFSGVTERPVLSALREFSAPVRLTVTRDPAELLFLMRRDGDPFNRWRALQDYAMRLFIEGTRTIRDGGEPTIDKAFVDALGEIAEDEALDPAFRAQALQLPSEADIAREISQDVDPDAISAARRLVRSAAAARNRSRLLAWLARQTEPGEYAPDAAGAGGRSLRNTVRDLVAADGETGVIALVADRYRTAGNMTDRIAALQTLVLSGGTAAEDGLADFYERYRDEPLVIDKWLTLQAAAPFPAALDRVKALTEHPAFTFANPNRIRALIGAFASGNQSQFNRADGEGFRFVADMVLLLDGRNPQVASRLLSNFRSWRALETGRRDRAFAELQRVAGTATLSRDVRDIATRCLQ